MVDSQCRTSRPTKSETVVGDTISEVLRLSDNRVILATFASNVHRMQRVIGAAKNIAQSCGNGRSMVNVNIAMELGYLKDRHKVWWNWSRL